MLNNPKAKNIFLISLLILAIGFVAYAYYYSQMGPVIPQQQPSVTENDNPPPSAETAISENEETAPVVSPTNTPTPRPLPHGKRTFVVSLPANAVGPRIGKGTIDPYDPVLNGKQTVTIEVNDSVPVQKVVAVLQTDNKTVEQAMAPQTPGQTKGNWTGTWTVDDTYNQIYTLTIKATSAKGTTMADITTR